MRRHTDRGRAHPRRRARAAPRRRGWCAPATSAATATGYPDGLAGEEIPLGARIVAVCDAFDAMISDRPYRAAHRRRGRARRAAPLRGTQFDPAVVEAFCAELDADARDAAAREESEDDGLASLTHHMRRALAGGRGVDADAPRDPLRPRRGRAGDRRPAAAPAADVRVDSGTRSCQSGPTMWYDAERGVANHVTLAYDVRASTSSTTPGRRSPRGRVRGTADPNTVTCAAAGLRFVKFELVGHGRHHGLPGSGPGTVILDGDPGNDDLTGGDGADIL